MQRHFLRAEMISLYRKRLKYRTWSANRMAIQGWWQHVFSKTLRPNSKKVVKTCWNIKCYGTVTPKRPLKTQKQIIPKGLSAGSISTQSTSINLIFKWIFLVQTMPTFDSENKVGYLSPLALRGSKLTSNTTAARVRSSALIWLSSLITKACHVVMNNVYSGRDILSSNTHTLPRRRYVRARPSPCSVSHPLFPYL